MPVRYEDFLIKREELRQPPEGARMVLHATSYRSSMCRRQLCISALFFLGDYSVRNSFFKICPQKEKFGITGNPKGLHVKDFGYKKPVIHRLRLRVK